MRGSLLFLFDPGRKSIHFGIQVIDMMQEESFQGHGQFGRTELVFSVMAEDQMLEKKGQVLGKSGIVLIFSSIISTVRIIWPRSRPGSV